MLFMSALPLVVFKPYTENISGNKKWWFRRNTSTAYQIRCSGRTLTLRKKWSNRSATLGNLQTSGWRKILCTIFTQFRISVKLDLLRAGLFGVRAPVGGGEIIHTVKTGPGSHPASYTINTEVFSSVKRPGCGLIHPPPPIYCRD